MPVIAVETPFNISIDLNIAPFWKRFLAYGIDALIITIYWFVYVYIIEDNLPEHTGIRKLAVIFIFTLPVSLYHFLMEVFFSGQSVGKKLMNIRVVNFAGNEAGISQYLIRMLFRSYMLAPLAVMVIVSVFYELATPKSNVLAVVFVLMLGLTNLGMFLYYISNRYGQRLGDKMANTLVIETYAAADIHQTIFQDIADEAYKVRYPEVMHLTDQDINGIRNLLNVKRITKETETYMQRIATRIQEVLKISSDQDPYDFLAQLLRDYNFLTSRSL